MRTLGEAIGWVLGTAVALSLLGLGVYVVIRVLAVVFDIVRPEPRDEAPRRER